MTYDQYLALGFAVLFASFALGFKNSVVKKLSALFSVSFLLQTVAGFLNKKYLNLLLIFYSYLLIAVAFFYSISLTKTIRSLKNKAYLDALTKVNNRMFFEEVLKKELENYEKLGINYCILFIDMYNFKDINDIYGHAKGDEVLAEVGYRLRKHLRSDDFIIRYGGDEFIVVLKDIKEDKIFTVIERLKSALTFEVNGTQVKANVGYAVYPKDGASVDELIKIASARMYEDKKLYEKNEAV
ncbi:GGDEF domain-containing protein [Hydrogenobacter hydrogenophilus]|uniref:Diguanylate cyclase (GGDEF) domain-containing protein n=1 Tax=Hydrogenobacter hydrogenophilus TaxID=35835 RepID=A0A285NYF9_9AQUI|nr:GGDEF domain-containing protein [Hydrogenobacter hydrogenophilus]SNZ14479.1 diguanylate cyclase (GGDEF) domain-containing protein [Hydrogenobacter hydrogenophilus]